MNLGVGASILLMIGATAAVASCPVAADLADGIYVTYDDDSMTRYSGTIGGEVEEWTRIEDGSGDVYVVPTISGLFATGYIDWPEGKADETTRETVVFDKDLAQFLPVRAGQIINLNLKRSFVSGGEPDTERYSVVVGQEKTVELAGCSYIALQVTHTFVSGDGVFGLVQEYLPELGIGIYTSYAELGETPDVYQVLEISTLAPE